MAEIDISEAKIFFACGALWDACGGQLTPHGITYGTALGDGDGPNRSVGHPTWGLGGATQVGRWAMGVTDIVGEGHFDETVVKPR